VEGSCEFPLDMGSIPCSLSLDVLLLFIILFDFLIVTVNLEKIEVGENEGDKEIIELRFCRKYVLCMLFPFLAFACDFLY